MRRVAVAASCLVLLLPASAGAGQERQDRRLHRAVREVSDMVWGIETYLALPDMPKASCHRPINTLTRWTGRRLRRVETSLGLDPGTRISCEAQVDRDLVWSLWERYMATEAAAG